MSKIGPDPTQKTLTVDPRQQRELLRRVKLGSTSRKAFMYALDSHIGSSNREWTLTYAELGEEIEQSEKSTYRIAGDLERLGVIRRVPDKARRVTFSICWGVLWALDEEQRNGHETVDSVRAGENAILTGANEKPVAILAGANNFRAGEKIVRAGENAPISTSKHKKAQEAPQPPERAAAVPRGGARFDPAAVDLPENLRTPAFRVAWGEWIEFRREKRKPLSRRAVDKQLSDLIRYGPDSGVAAINEAIRNDWQGLFPKETTHGKPNGSNPPKFRRETEGPRIRTDGEDGLLSQLDGRLKRGASAP